MVQAKRLYESTNPVIAGVCGGIAEYFNLDPTLVRVLAVVLLVSSIGAFLIFYLAAMAVIPKDPMEDSGYVARVSAQDAVQPPTEDATQAPAREALKRRWSTAVMVGVLLICVGVLTLLTNLIDVSVWKFWPLVLVALGIVQLFTPTSHGWSVDRAGAAIVLISFGILLLALTLGAIDFRTIIIAFGKLWPVLLIVLGFAIIAGAKKQVAFGLISSLLLSATMLLGVWLFGGLGDTLLIQLSEEKHAVIEIPVSPMPMDPDTVEFANKVLISSPLSHGAD